MKSRATRSQQDDVWVYAFDPTASERCRRRNTACPHPPLAEPLRHGGRSDIERESDMCGFKFAAYELMCGPLVRHLQPSWGYCWPSTHPVRMPAGRVE